MDSFVTGFSSSKLDRTMSEESDTTGSLRFLPRTIPSQNLAARLRAREIFGTSFCRGNARINTSRGFYTNIYPSYTMVNVEKPPCFLRKFSPDGKRFIAFSQCQTHLEVYEYLGPAAGGELMEFFDSNVSDCPADFLPNEETWFTARVRSKAFDTYFSLEHYIPLTSVGGEQLNRECSLFSEDGDFVIVGSASYVPDDHHPSMWELRQNNESVTPNSRNPLEDYTLYSIEIAEGLLIDKITFKTDKIFLSHNQGLYLYKDTLAILSVQHQTIHVYKYVYGKFIEVVKIGRVLYEDDVYFLSTVLTADQQTSLPGNFVYRECREQTINMLKHRILTWLYHRAVQLSEQDNNPFELRRFYQYFDQIRSLRMWKMQLLDSDHLLIKYANEDVVTLRCPEPNSQPSFFVVYNMTAKEVIAVYDNTSEQLLELFENFCDFFRNTNVNPSADELYSSQYTSSPSNNIFSHLIQQRFKQTIMSAKNGGVTEARKRVLAQLPISAQSYSSSPYLDLSLFSYDEKWVSVMERPKACGEHPIQFYGRQCGLVKFRIFAGVQGRHAPPSARRLVAFIFHPTDPFAISVQKTNLEYVVNFHVRKPPTS